MGHAELLSFADDFSLAKAAALQWLNQLEHEFQPSSPYCVALSGGRIARRLFQSIASQANERSPVRNLHYFWSDERCVPPSDPESNFALAYELLLAPLTIPQVQIHRLRGEDPPEAAASAGVAELRALASSAPGEQPILNLIFLGMGEDGHVASLFPGERDHVVNSPLVYRPVLANKPPPHRITLGYKAIAAARQVWVLASGPGKEMALQKSLSGEADTPLGRVVRLRKHTRIFTDVQVTPSENFRG